MVTSFPKDRGQNAKESPSIPFNWMGQLPTAVKLLSSLFADGVVALFVPGAGHMDVLVQIVEISTAGEQLARPLIEITTVRKYILRPYGARKSAILNMQIVDQTLAVMATCIMQSSAWQPGEILLTAKPYSNSLM